MADRIKATIDRVSSIADNPDEITNRFAILRIIDDIAFEINVRALNIYLCFIGREAAEHHPKNMPFCESYRELALAAAETCKKMAKFFEGLAKLIIDDLYAVTKTIGAAGGALAILANEFRSLADKIMEIAN